MIKRSLTISLALLLCLLLACPVWAVEPPYATAGDLYESWFEQNHEDPFPYPEYVNGVWSVDGTIENLCFSLVAGTPDSCKEEILAQVADKSTVHFAEGGSRTIRELVQIQRAIDARMGPDAGIYATGIDEYTGRVCVTVDRAKKDALKEELTALYGDAVLVVGGDPAQFLSNSNDIPLGVDKQDALAPMSPLRPTVQSASRQSSLPWILGALGLVLLGGAALVLFRRKQARLQPAEGESASGTEVRSTREIAAAIRESSIVPPPELRDKVMEAAKKIP